VDGSGWDRRDILKATAAAGVGSVVFARALSALAAEAGPGAVTPTMVAQAEWVAGISLSDAQRELMLKDLAQLRKDVEALRAIPLDNGVAPALVFRPGADHTIPGGNPERVIERLGSSRKELVDCPNSYHVISLDHDAPMVRERVLAFLRSS